MAGQFIICLLRNSLRGLPPKYPDRSAAHFQCTEVHTPVHFNNMLHSQVHCTLPWSALCFTCSARIATLYEVYWFNCIHFRCFAGSALCLTCSILHSICDLHSHLVNTSHCSVVYTAHTLRYSSVLAAYALRRPANALQVRCILIWVGNICMDIVEFCASLYY